MIASTSNLGLTDQMVNPLFDLNGKVAVITGGNSGIGLGCARGLAKAGADIAIWGRNSKKNEVATRELHGLGVKVIACEVDVTNRKMQDAAADRTVSEFGGIDILLTSAGITKRKRPEDFSVAEIEEILTVNIIGTFESCQIVYPHFLQRGGGKIITIGSLTSIFGQGISPAYAASKGGVLQLTKSLAVAWGKDNIQANCILPGWITTDLTDESRNMPGLNDQVIGRTPAGRWGSPADFEGIAVFLASLASDFVTGLGIAVDGGFSSTLVII